MYVYNFFLVITIIYFVVNLLNTQFIKVNTYQIIEFKIID